MAHITAIVATYGDLSFNITTKQGLSPDMVDTILTRMGRELVARARQLEMTAIAPTPAPAEE